MTDKQSKIQQIILGTLCVGVTIVSPLAFSSCGSHNHDDHENETKEHTVGHADNQTKETEEGSKAGAIHMEPEDAQRYGVAVVDIQRGVFKEAVKTAAEILPSSTDMATASASTSGVVQLAQGITQGSSVKAGQMIARIKGSGISGGDANAAGKAALDNAKRELDRVTPLLED